MKQSIRNLEELLDSNLQLIWQTGKPYASKAKERVAGRKHVWVNEFINQMEHAYVAADIVISRAGAMAISELCVVEKPFFLCLILLLRKIIKQKMQKPREKKCGVDGKG
jgi:UDP-N-acetylglucosamine:LPS N-acetylglucosamine transferase